MHLCEKIYVSGPFLNVCSERAEGIKGFFDRLRCRAHLSVVVWIVEHRNHEASIVGRLVARVGAHNRNVEQRFETLLDIRDHAGFVGVGVERSLVSSIRIGFLECTPELI